MFFLLTWVQSIWVPSKCTARPAEGSDQAVVTSSLAVTSSSVTMTEAVVSSPQQSRVAAASVDQLGQELAALIRQAQHQHTKEHTVISQDHKYIRNHPAKPWR
jgi:hypothetical protein